MIEIFIIFLMAEIWIWALANSEGTISFIDFLEYQWEGIKIVLQDIKGMF